ncbi:protease complex subunit PrcB family protein [Nanoarchaeota archaeon]
MNKKYFFGAIILLILISGCGTQIPESSSFETISHSSSGTRHQEKQDYVIINEDDLMEMWEKVYTNVDPVPELPDVNFDEEMVIAVFLGTKPTGGYTIEITEVVETEDSLEVYVKETSPSPRNIVALAVTYPEHIVKVEKTDKEVVFKR